MSKRKGPLTPDGKKPITIVSASRKTDRINLINTPTPNKKSKKTYEVIDLVSDEEDTPKKTQKTSSMPPSLQQPISYQPYQKEYDEIVEYMKNNPPQDSPNTPDSSDSEAPTPPRKVVQQPWDDYDIQTLHDFHGIDQTSSPIKFDKKTRVAYYYLYGSIFKELKDPVGNAYHYLGKVGYLDYYDQIYGIEKALYKWQFNLKYRFQHKLREHPSNYLKQELHWNDLTNLDKETYNDFIQEENNKNSLTYEQIFKLFGTYTQEAFNRQSGFDSSTGEEWTEIFSLPESLKEWLNKLEEYKNMPAMHLKYPEPTQTFLDHFNIVAIPRAEKVIERLLSRALKAEEYLKKYKWSNMTAASRLAKEKNLPQKAKYNIMEYLG